MEQVDRQVDFDVEKDKTLFDIEEERRLFTEDMWRIRSAR